MIVLIDWMLSVTVTKENTITKKRTKFKSNVAQPRQDAQVLAIRTHHSRLQSTDIENQICNLV